MLIAFEGIDGSGKNTQIELLRREFAGRMVFIFRYPDLEGKFGAEIRGFLEGRKSLSPEQQFRLFAEDIRKDQARIKTLLKSGALVIADRYIHSTVAYQTASGLSFEKALLLAAPLGLTQPDLVVWLDADPIIGQQRKLAQRQAADEQPHEFEKNISLQARVRSAYEKMFSQNFFSKKWLHLDALQPPGKISAEIKEYIASQAKK